MTQERDLGVRILFTLLFLAVYGLGAHIPAPGIDVDRLAFFFETGRPLAGISLADSLSGGMFHRLTIFALGLMPYISAAMVLQLVRVVVPPVRRLWNKGEWGRRRITWWTRWLAIGLAAVQSFAIATALMNADFVLRPGIGFILTTTLTLTAGATLLMWLGEQISQQGVGYGMSLIILTGIMVMAVRIVREFVTSIIRYGPQEFLADILMASARRALPGIVAACAVLVFMVWLERSSVRNQAQAAIAAVSISVFAAVAYFPVIDLITGRAVRALFRLLPGT